MQIQTLSWIHFLYFAYVVLLSFPFNYAHAKKPALHESNNGMWIELHSKDGNIIPLQANADDDEDGIANTLEINGFTYSPANGLQPWDGDPNTQYYRTDPLRWSTDGDPYSDFMEVSGVNMPAGVPSPENNPLVAARPVININMTDYDVIPISEITNTQGGEQSSSFTNETSSSHEVGGEVTVEASLNPFKLVGGSVTASYSHTWTRTQSTTSSFGRNWSNTRSTNPSQAARLQLRVYIQNLGSATALDVVPTFNLVLGDKTIATITPNETADRLAPNGLPRSRYPEAGTIVIDKDNQNNDIILSLEELKAIQSGAPLALVVTQVQADVARWNPATQSFDSREEWSSFEGEIDPVVVNLKAKLGDEDIRRYQVYVGTDFYDLGFTFQDVLSQVFEIEENNGQTLIENRIYPDNWYVSTPSQQVIDEWNQQGQPESLLGLEMFRNTNMVMMSPGDDPQANIDLAIFDPNFKRVFVSAFAGNFPILSVRAQVTINGEIREIELTADNNSLYTNSTKFETPADPDGQVIVENARGDITTINISKPALYQNAAEVKQFSELILNPGDEFLLFSQGDPDKPVKLYCLFYDPDSGDELENPREYLTLPESDDTTNYTEWLQDFLHRRIYFDKIRIDPNTFVVDSSDDTFTTVEWISEDQVSPYEPEPVYFGSIRLDFAHLKTTSANINLSGTPFSLDPYTEFQHADRGAQDLIYVDETRKIISIEAQVPPNHDTDSQGFIGVKPGPISLVYNRTLYDGGGFNLSGKSIEFNQDPDGEQGYINMGSSTTLEVTDAITLEAWIKPEVHARTLDMIGVLINKEGEYELFYFPDGTIRWAIANNSPGWRTMNTYYKAEPGKWTHVALVYDQNEPDPSIKTYINGNLFHALVGSGPIGDHPVHVNQDSFRVATREATSPTNQYAGAVDEVRVWNIARSEDEIRENMMQPLGSETINSTESGLIGYWRFDELEDLQIGEDGADDVRDLSVNNNHGDLLGDARLIDETADVSDFMLY